MENMKLEELFEAAKDTIEKMSDSSLPLEEAFKLYEEGIKLINAANERIDAVEKKVLELDSDGETSDFV